MTDLMAFRQHIDRIKRTFFIRFLIAGIIDGTATATTRHLAILIRIFNGTTATTRTILITLILDLHRAAATSSFSSCPAPAPRGLRMSPRKC